MSIHPPRQHAVEAFAKRKFADPESRFVMPDRPHGPVVEDEVAEVRMSIQTTEVGMAELHEDLTSTVKITRVVAVIGLADRIGFRVKIPGRPIVKPQRALLDKLC